MRRAVPGFLCAVAVLAFAGSGAAAELVLKRVALSTGGVGYFEYEAMVDGNASLQLDVPLDQVDDVLKSLAIYDSGGSAGEITLPGREPLAHSLSDLPFDRAALNSETDLLNALQGAEITVAAPQPIRGRLVHADREAPREDDGKGQTRTRVSVLTEAGLRQFVLADVEALAFADPQLQRQVETALQRIAAYRAAGRRQLTLHLRGAGSRAVRVGYVVAMPLWKATYRLSLPAAGDAPKARLQGWAVLENFSGRAWNEVSLSLVSGEPVTFRQALYESYYVPRPNVPVESGRHVLPPPDTGAMAAEPGAAREERGAARAAEGTAGMAKAMAAPATPAAAAPPSPLAHIDAAAAAEEAAQIAFTLPQKISVPAGQSLLVPLLDRDLPARRIDLYQPSVDGRHPLGAVELTNDSGTGLPPGVLTLYQQGAADGALYLGDARLAALPAGDKRLLSYTLDGKVTIDRETEEQRPIVKATIAGGVVKVTRAIHFTTRYRVKAAGPAPPLLIEQPRRGNATLTLPDPKSVELTAGAYRIPYTVPAGGGGMLTVVEEQPLQETIRIADLDDNRLGALVSAGEFDPQLRQALAEVAARRQAVAAERAGLARLKERRGQLVADEQRLRDNLSVLGADPAMKKRLLDKFNAAETEIEELTAATATASDRLAAAERELTAFVAGLTL